MKRSRFSEEQIIAILKEQENGLPTKRDALQKFGQSAPEKVSASIDKFENLMAEKMYEYELQLMKLYRY